MSLDPQNSAMKNNGNREIWQVKFQSHSLTLSIFAQRSFLFPLGYIAFQRRLYCFWMSFMCAVPSEMPGTISVFGPHWTPSGMLRTGSDLFLPLPPPQSSIHPWRWEWTLCLLFFLSLWGNGWDVTLGRPQYIRQKLKKGRNVIISVAVRIWNDN